MLHGIFTNIFPKNHPNVGKYTIPGASGLLLIADFPIIRTSIGSPSPQALKPPEAAALLHGTPPALQLQQLTPLDLRNVRQTSPVGAEAWIFSGKKGFEA